ncbi:MAG: Cytoplasmic membrane protein FsxA, partial [uncultured Solirubrobacterales bacterium]
ALAPRRRRLHRRPARGAVGHPLGGRCHRRPPHHPHPPGRLDPRQPPAALAGTRRVAALRRRAADRPHAEPRARRRTPDRGRCGAAAYPRLPDRRGGAAAPHPAHARARAAGARARDRATAERGPGRCGPRPASRPGSAAPRYGLRRRGHGDRARRLTGPRRAAPDRAV